MTPAQIWSVAQSQPAQRRLGMAPPPAQDGLVLLVGVLALVFAALLVRCSPAPSPAQPVARVKRCPPGQRMIGWRCAVTCAWPDFGGDPPSPSGVVTVARLLAGAEVP